MTTDKLRSRLSIKPLIGSIAALLLGSSPGFAKAIGGDATWIENPADGNWFNSSNWSTGFVPDNSTAIASFGPSKVTNIGIGSFTGLSLGGMTFNSNASAYSIYFAPFNYLNLFGAGITNNSGKNQTISFDVNTDLNLFNQATLGKNVTIHLGTITGAEGNGTSVLTFFNNSNAGSANIIAGGGGHIIFRDNSDGGTSSIKVVGTGHLDISWHTSGPVHIGSLEGNGNVFLGANNLIVGGNNKSTVFSGNIQDGGEGAFEGPEGAFSGFGGSLTKVGTGSLTLSGVNTYTGNTIINGGALIVDGAILASPSVYINPGGVLGGHGFIGGAVINNGFVSPGNSPGTLSIGGDYWQGHDGGLLIQVASPKVYDHLLVGGTASLGGTLVIDPLDPTKIKKGETFHFLSAEGGVYGTFASHETVDTNTLLRFKILYGDHEVYLKSYFAPFSSVDGLTPNQTAVAKALDSAMNDRHASKLINFLGVQQINLLPGDFDKIAPEEYSSIFSVGESIDNVQSINLQRRTDDIRSGSNGFSAAGLAMNGYNPSFNGPIQFRTGVAGPNGNGDDGKMTKEVKPIIPAESRWGAFLTGTGEWVGVGDDFNAKGYDIANGGFTLGVDYKFTPHFAAGIMAGYVGTSVHANDGGRVFANGGKLGVYATFFENRQPAAPASTGLSKDSSKESKAVVVAEEVNPGWYADLAVTGGYSSYDVHRSALEGTARGDTDGGDLNVLVGAGYDFKRGGFTFGPTASFNYTYVGIGDFTENGSLAPLHFNSQGQESIRTAFGIKASYDWKVGGLLIKPELRAAWQHEYGDAAYEIDSSFANGAGNTFTVNGPRIGRDSLLLGAGFAIQVNERFSTYFYYDGELGRTRYDSHAVTGGVRLAF